LNIASLRQDYKGESLNEADVASDPFTQFQRWFDEALRAELPMANAMTLATVGADGAPSARIVLLKGIDHNGFVFYTNYMSRKGRELAGNPRAALVFHWTDLEREVRIDGNVEKVTAAESDEYFASRPLGSRHAAIASPQSEVVASRAVLEARFNAAAADHGEAAPRPAHWGGYRVLPGSIEFWQGRPSRLHDRLLYTRSGERWAISRLAP
jgi:pyridoxamine 5'-phosphate oxidase